MASRYRWRQQLIGSLRVRRCHCLSCRLSANVPPWRVSANNSWTSWGYQPTATYYAEENDNRQHEGVDRALIVNTTSLGLESPWIEKLFELTQGYYNQIDKDSLTETQDDVS